MENQGSATKKTLDGDKGDGQFEERLNGAPNK
jgi:hypothetical protein